MRLRRVGLVIVGTLVATAVAPVRAQQQPQFINGLAQPVFSTAGLITQNVWIEVPNLDTDRDGINDRIRIQVRRPAATESGTRLPIVMTASPYSGGQLPFPVFDITGELYEPANVDANGLDLRVPDPPPPTPPAGTNPPYTGTNPPIPTLTASTYQSYFLPRGFIFVEAQNLGTGQSTGCPTIGGVEESLAMKAVIDWFNGIGSGWDQSGTAVTAYWTTGNTTMIGVSYDGTLPIAAASTGVAGLKAIVPIAGVSSYYDHRRSYGVVINSNPTVGTDADTLFDNILSRDFPQVCQYMRDQIAVLKDRTSGDWNAWWEERDYTRYVGNFQAAVLISHGLNDLNVKPRHFARFWEALTANNIPRKIWLNTGGHGDGANSGTRQAAWRDELNRFWSQYLFGVDNNWTGGPRAAVQRSTNVWADYADWPVPGAEATTFRLVPIGNNTSGFLRVDNIVPDHIVEDIVDNSVPDATALVQLASSPNRLVYKSQQLTAPVHISGTPKVRLHMSFGQGSATVSAILVQYNANGTSTIICRGWADPQNRYSISQTYAITPGAPYDIEFTLQPHDYIFPAGTRIGLVVMSSDRLFTLRPPPGREMTVDGLLSSFDLPIVGGGAAFLASSIAAPTAPDGLTATATSASSVTLSWSDNAGTETGFRIERSSNGVSFAPLATVGADATSYVDASIVSGAATFYRVRAFNVGGGDSAPSNTFDIGAPVIASPALASAVYGSPFAYQVTASYVPASYFASGLPVGVEIDPLTGLIGGTPGQSGAFAVTLNATNPLGTGVGELTLTVSKAAATVTLGNLSQSFNGSARTVDAATTPPGLNVVVTYDGGASPPSAIGSYVVGATIDDPNYEGGATATLEIRDTTAPTIESPADVLVSAIDASGATATYALPLAHDDVDPTVSVSCAPASGAHFALGTTLVTCSASDTAGNVAAPVSFTVHVDDTTPPSLTVPASISVPAATASGAIVNFMVTASDAVAGTLTPICLPASGSTFAIRQTTVTCTATDPSHNVATATFVITVNEVTTPGEMRGDGYVRNGAARYTFDFDVRETARSGERGSFALEVDETRVCNCRDQRGRSVKHGDRDDRTHDCRGNDRDDRFRSRSVDFVAFTDDPTFRPGRPARPQVDTVVFSGTGDWNGRRGYRFEVRATDQGEPGRHREMVAITIWDPSGNVVASIDGDLDGGNIQSTRIDHGRSTRWW